MVLINTTIIYKILVLESTLFSKDLLFGFIKSKFVDTAVEETDWIAVGNYVCLDKSIYLSV